MGRTRYDLDEKERIQLEALAPYLTMEQIADFYGISQKTFQAMRERDEEIASIYKRGKGKAVAKMASSLFQNGIKGNITAQIFYLKTQGGWREVEHPVTDIPQLVINVTNEATEQNLPES